TRSLCDWSSDVCSSDLGAFGQVATFADLPFVVGLHQNGTGERTHEATGADRPSSPTRPSVAPEVPSVGTFRSARGGRVRAGRARTRRRTGAGRPNPATMRQPPR